MNKISEKKIRVGGLVKMNSVRKNEASINFIITDLNKEILVSYKGLVPNLFSEGKGIVAEGKLKDNAFVQGDKESLLVGQKVVIIQPLKYEFLYQNEHENTKNWGNDPLENVVFSICYVWR